MMIDLNYCLTSKDIEEFIQSEVEGIELENNSLSSLVDKSRGWDLQLSIISYLLARVLLNIKKNNPNKVSAHLLKVFELKEEMYLEIDEMDYDFIEYMIRHLNNDQYTLEEELIELKQNMSEYSYERALRY